jgi:hypothetical protein
VALVTVRCCGWRSKGLGAVGGGRKGSVFIFTTPGSTLGAVTSRPV